MKMQNTERESMDPVAKEDAMDQIKGDMVWVQGSVIHRNLLRLLFCFRNPLHT